MFFDYRVMATAKVSVGANQGYVRGNIASFDTTAGMWFHGANFSNGFMWYGPMIKGPLGPGLFTVTMEAATDAGHTIAINQTFHQVLLLGA